MLKIDHAIVALSLTDKDSSTIKYADLMSKILNLKKIYFVHVAKSLEIPKDILEKHPDLMHPLDESLGVDMKRMVDENFTNKTDVEYDCLVEEGNRKEKILHLSVVKNVDLIILGTSRSMKGSLLSTQLAHKAPCSVLSVPYNTKANVTKIAVASDYSECAERAVELAVSCSSYSQIPIVNIHAYDVPIGYAKTGMSYEKFAEIMKNNSMVACEDFMKNIECADANITHKYILEHDSAKAVRDCVQEESADILMVGCRGRSAAAKLILGSVTEELLMTAQLPIFSVKKKGENMGFLKALLQI